MGDADIGRHHARAQMRDGAREQPELIKRTVLHVPVPRHHARFRQRYFATYARDI